MNTVIAASVVRRAVVAVALTAQTVVVGCAALRDPVPVHVIDPASECARLRERHSYAQGFRFFPDAADTVQAIPWCFPATRGQGVLGYNVELPVTRAGTLTIALTDISPSVRFAAVSVAGRCTADNTGKAIQRLGHGTTWSMTVTPGDHCLTMITAKPSATDVWFTMTVKRP